MSQLRPPPKPRPTFKDRETLVAAIVAQRAAVVAAEGTLRLLTEELELMDAALPPGKRRVSTAVEMSVLARKCLEVVFAQPLLTVTEIRAELRKRGEYAAAPSVIDRMRRHPRIFERVVAPPDFPRWRIIGRDNLTLEQLLERA